jgi:hypothetical protein
MEALIRDDTEVSHRQYIYAWETGTMNRDAGNLALDSDVTRRSNEI